MVFEAVLGDEARAVVSMAIASLEATRRRFASKPEARTALEAAIAAALSGPFVATRCTTEASALGAAIRRNLSRGRDTSISQLWLEARPWLLGGGPAALADSQRLFDELLRRHDAVQRPPAMVAAAGSAAAQGHATQQLLSPELPPAVNAQRGPEAATRRLPFWPLRRVQRWSLAR